MPQDAPTAPIPDSEKDEGMPQEPELLKDIMQKPLLKRLGIYTRLSGPGWLQSAITLGGGSLASSLFVGVLLGFSVMWLQPLAMILGIVMLSAIGYVALSTGRRPFGAINEHVNPVLGWGWALATAMANIVWCLPQFSLGVSSARQNILPSLFGPGVMPEFWGKFIPAAIILGICVVVIWFYDKGARGIRVFETFLKVLVGIVILCFFGVVIKMTAAGVLDWNGIFSGFVPNPSILLRPASSFNEALQATGQFADYWSSEIVYMQRDVMISAAATAVGINMTFLLPYSMLAKGWRKNARGLAVFDLSLGLFIPFMLATGCVVIASATQFHTQYHPGVIGEPYRVRGQDKVANAPESGELDAEELPDLSEPSGGMLAKYKSIANARVKHEIGAEAFAKLSAEEKAAKRAALPEGDKRMSAMLIKRSAFDLADSLQPLTGDVFSHYIFGIGVIGMAISSIIILMLISGFVVCEMIGVPPRGNAHRLACLLPCIGFLGPFIWSKAAFWLAVPTSVFGMVLAPIAYWTFFCLMNSKSLLGEAMPRGARRVWWNTLMLIAAAVITFGSVYSIWNKAGLYGLGGLGLFLLLLIVVQIKRGGVELEEIREEGEEA
jgi:Mn2+/Fe2+ NRAMP family transporter